MLSTKASCTVPQWRGISLLIPHSERPCWTVAGHPSCDTLIERLCPRCARTRWRYAAQRFSLTHGHFSFLAACTDLIGPP